MYISTVTYLASRFETRLDIWHRNVPWSSVKQFLSVVETGGSVDEVFENFRMDWMNKGHVMFKRAVQKHQKSNSDAMERALRQGAHCPFMQLEQDSLTALYYRMMNFPWCVSLHSRLASNPNLA